MRRRKLLNVGLFTIAATTASPAICKRTALAQADASSRALEQLALNRMGFGPRRGDIDRVKTMGFAAYVEEQLNPDYNNDAACQQRLETATLPRHLWESDGENQRTRGQKLTTLNQTLTELWQLFDEDSEEEDEWWRPLAEVNAATWIRAVYSRWQLQEVLVDFWHNHFNVNAYADDPRILITWPFYDRTMRQHALGNFRTFLEAVAQSPPMLFYLDNAISRASPANENFARELFELHTLGAEHYVSDRYQNWRDVPRGASGLPIGFMDEDVYEAARAFTGWTVANGEEIGEVEFLPNTGAFHYYEGWHDPYQKRILGVELAPNQSPLVDGQTVLDLVAYHPGTARHICTKLCRRLVTDDPPESLVEQAIATWTATQKEPHQIQQTVRTILLSAEFRGAHPPKVKRPFDLFVSYLRATDADFSPSLDMFGMTESTGHILFGWPTPAGHPDTAQYWLGTHSLLGSWQGLAALTQGEFASVNLDLIGQLPQSLETPRQIVDYWLHRLIGYPLPESNTRTLIEFIAPDQSPDEPWQISRAEVAERLTQLVPLIAMAPEFRWR